MEAKMSSSCDFMDAVPRTAATLPQRALVQHTYQLLYSASSTLRKSAWNQLNVESFGLMATGRKAYVKLEHLTARIFCITTTGLRFSGTKENEHGRSTVKH